MTVYQEEPRCSVGNNKVCFMHNYASHPRELVGLHWHDAYEILYIRRGFGEQRINADTTEIRTGDVIIICPGDIHYTVALAPSGCDVDVVQFSSDFLPNPKESLQELRSGVYRSEDNNVPLLFDQLSECKDDDRPGQDLIVAGRIHTLCGFLVRFCHPDHPPQCSSTILAICSYIEEQRDIRLEQVAAHFNYSPEHLSRRFHTETGVAYRSWCDRVRMRRAVALLNDKSRTITEITEILGYGDDSSFIRAFKRRYGMTPNAYRHRHI